MQSFSKRVMKLTDPEFFTGKDLKNVQEFLQQPQIKFLSDPSTYSQGKTNIVYTCFWFQDMAAEWRRTKMNKSSSAMPLPTYETLLEETKKEFGDLNPRATAK